MDEEKHYPNQDVSSSGGSGHIPSAKPLNASYQSVSQPHYYPVFQPTKRRSFWASVGVGIVIIIFFFSLILNLILIGLQPTEREGEELISGSMLDPYKIVVVDIHGVIEQSTDSFGYDNYDWVVEQIAKARDDDAVKAVILDVDSPGGGVTASDILYQKIKKLSEAKPVIVCMGDLAASGGYYISLPAQKIYARPTTVTGSIGVIMWSVNLEGLMEKIGVSEVSIKSGAKKDILSPFREMTPEEKEMLTSIIMDLYGTFRQRVLDNRTDLTEADLDNIADGSVFTASQAVENKLVDEVGYLDDAIAYAKSELPQYASKLKVTRYKRSLGLLDLLSMNTMPSTLEIKIEGLEKKYGTHFYYLWEAGK